MGTRGCRRVSRGCGDACSVRESRTITLLVRRRASAFVLGVTVVRRESSAITLIVFTIWFVTVQTIA